MNRRNLDEANFTRTHEAHFVFVCTKSDGVCLAIQGDGSEEYTITKGRSLRARLRSACRRKNTAVSLELHREKPTTYNHHGNGQLRKFPSVKWKLLISYARFLCLRLVWVMFLFVRSSLFRADKRQ